MVQYWKQDMYKELKVSKDVSQLQGVSNTAHRNIGSQKLKQQVQGLHWSVPGPLYICYGC